MTGIPKFSVLQKKMYSCMFIFVMQKVTITLGIKEKIFFVFLKLKQDLYFAMLAMFF